MKRKQAIEDIKVAAYHEDIKQAMRIYVESRVSHRSYTLAVAEGRRLKAAGVPCSCHGCNK